MFRACRRAGTDDAVDAVLRRRRRASGPALLGGATGLRSGPFKPVQKLLTKARQPGTLPGTLPVSTVRLKSDSRRHVMCDGGTRLIGGKSVHATLTGEIGSISSTRCRRPPAELSAHPQLSSSKPP